MSRFVFISLLLVGCGSSAGATPSGGPEKPGDGGAPSDAGTKEPAEAGALDHPDAAPMDAGTKDSSDAGAVCDKAKPFGHFTMLAQSASGGSIPFARVSADERSLYIVRNYADGLTPSVATRANPTAAFGAETPVTFDQNPALTSLWASDDGQDLYASASSAAPGPIPWLRIYRFERDTVGVYANRTLVPLEGETTPVDLENPFVTSDGMTIYYARFPNGSTRQLWRSSLVSPNPEPVTELNSGISTGDRAPVLTPDERSIYFQSARGSLGTPTVWQADRLAKGAEFQNVRATGVSLIENNSTSIGSTLAITPIGVSADECRLYVLHNREQAADRIFMLTR